MQNKSFWAITSYFNPCGYRRRLTNFKIFRKYLDIPLIAIELSFNGRYELEPADADILIQLQGKDIMWQKERLLNIGLDALPSKCSRVAWIDCDLVFANYDWYTEASLLLDQFNIVQLFRKVHHLPAAQTPESTGLDQIEIPQCYFSEYSVAYNLLTGRRVKNITRPGGLSKLKGVCGGAWAARKEILIENGFYDAFVAGGGDTAMAYAGSGKFRELPQLRPITKQQLKHYYAWAEPYSARVQGSMSFLNCDVFHLWHGDFIDRNYLDRHEKLKLFNFDPYADIRLGSEGCWQWHSHKKELHAYMASYFSCRKEDGEVDIQL